nr:WG repeat-containing protein [Leptospira interrogans]
MELSGKITVPTKFKSIGNFSGGLSNALTNK